MLILMGYLILEQSDVHDARKLAMRPLRNFSLCSLCKTGVFSFSLQFSLQFSLPISLQFV